MTQRKHAPWRAAAALSILLGPAAGASAQQQPDPYDPYGSDTLVDEIEADTQRQLDLQRGQRDPLASTPGTTEPEFGQPETFGEAELDQDIELFGESELDRELDVFGDPEELDRDTRPFGDRNAERFGESELDPGSGRIGESQLAPGSGRIGESEVMPPDTTPDIPLQPNRPITVPE